MRLCGGLTVWLIYAGASQDHDDALNKQTHLNNPQLSNQGHLGDEAERAAELVLSPDTGEPRSRARTVELVVGLAVAIAACVFTLLQLQPSLLVADTTPAGGDMGAHVWAPAYLRDNLLPNFRLTGWTPDWYAGFPAFHFYMIIPSLAIVALDQVLPYGVAFKLVTVSGVVLMPAAAWFLGRMARVPFPGPPLLAVGTLLFLFDTRFTIYGGNIASTLAGEFAFSIGLSFGLVYLGLLFRGLDTGEHRAWAALALALTGLSHLIPAFWVIIVTTIAFGFSGDYLRRLRWMAPMTVVAGLLSAFWVLPFVWRRAYLNDMGWEKLTEYAPNLRPDSGIWQGVFVFAAIAVVLSVLLRVRLGVVLGASVAVVGLMFVVMPQGRLWNARILPFYYLSLYLLAAIGLAQLGQLWRNLTWRVAVAVVGSMVVFFTVALPLGAIPGSVPDGGGYRFGSITTTTSNFVSAWAKWNYSGYERKTAYGEYYEVVTEMGELGESNGCGRAMWEYEKELDRFGTPMALMLLPHWTDGCIGSMEGLYFEASATTPYHFLNQSELSARPSRAQRDLPYAALDVEAGVEHLKLLGVKYYMAFSDSAVSQSRNDDDLTELMTIGEPWAVSHCRTEGGELARREDTECDGAEEFEDVSWQWTIFEVADAELVTPLVNEPAVLAGVSDGGEEWLDPSVDFYVDQSRWDVFLASDGPENWQRIDVDGTPETRPVTPVEVSDIEEGEQSISFRVDQPGSPVLVKTSYFPNWKVKGAAGPYRVAPNLMAVVPFDTDIELTYGWTTVDLVAWALTALGVVGIGVLALLRAPTMRPFATRDVAVYPGSIPEPDDETVEGNPDLVPFPSPGEDHEGHIPLTSEPDPRETVTEPAAVPDESTLVSGQDPVLLAPVPLAPVSLVEEGSLDQLALKGPAEDGGVPWETVRSPYDPPTDAAAEANQPRLPRRLMPGEESGSDWSGFVSPESNELSTAGGSLTDEAVEIVRRSRRLERDGESSSSAQSVTRWTDQPVGSPGTEPADVVDADIDSVAEPARRLGVAKPDPVAGARHGSPLAEPVSNPDEDMIRLFDDADDLKAR